MYDRLIRADLYQSERWLDLPSDTHRLVYNALIHLADDFGNFEGGSRRLWRLMHSFATVKTEVDALKIMSDLQDADLVRRYEVTDEHEVKREFWHMPRFKNTRTYWTRKYPASPWCDATAYTGPLRSYLKKEIDKKKSDSGQTQLLLSPDSDLKIGVGVGVGEVLKNNTRSSLTPNSTSQASDEKTDLKIFLLKLPRDWHRRDDLVEVVARRIGKWPPGAIPYSAWRASVIEEVERCCKSS
jgi:hypothetical protein